MERIIWTRPRGHSGLVGTVNGKRLFAINMGLHQGDGYVLRTQLPWNLKDSFSIGRQASEGEMKDRAERVLAAFVEKIGAAFPTDVPDAPVLEDH